MAKHIALPFVAVMASVLFSSAPEAQEAPGMTRYGSFLHSDELPEALFLVGEIQDGDFFELRRALREHDPQLIVTSSPGGSVYEALQLATVVHDNGLSTLVPEAGVCASACAFVYFGGTRRSVEGRLGVHQFYVSGEAAGNQVDLNTGLQRAQYTTSEIIAFLNEFGTPPFVYEYMFATQDIHYFDAEDAAALALDPDEAEFLALRAEVSATFAKVQEATALAGFANSPVAEVPSVSAPPAPASAPPPSIFEVYFGADLPGGDMLLEGIRNITRAECEQLCRESAACLAYSYVQSSAWCWPKAALGTLRDAPGVTSGIRAPSAGAADLETQALDLLVGVNQVWSEPNGFALENLPYFYAPEVNFYGQRISRDAVVAEKREFALRWPVRQYLVEPGSVRVFCRADGCTVDSVVLWDAAAPDRGARASGRSTWNLTLTRIGQGLYISSESGEVINRN